MKILKAYGLAFLVLLLSCSFIFVPTFFLPGPEVDLAVYARSSAREITNQLREKGILHFTFPFRVLVKLTGADRRLKAGLYRLSPRMSLWGVLTAMTEGRSELLPLKVPEGFSMDQIAQELETMKVATAADFLKTCQDPALLKELDIPGPSAEGFLFPETYRVPIGAGTGPLVGLMVRQFWEAVGPDFKRRCGARGLTPYQAVILASIVEKEAQRADERPIVAGVMFNRLRQKMRLQVNATLNYILNTRHAWLTNDEINNTRTPYNTYLHRGLPPTPICNPGAASLEAVLSPAEVPYLYYVAQGDGSHLFAATFQEHERNVAKAKRIRRAQRAAARAAGQNP